METWAVGRRRRRAMSCAAAIGGPSSQNSAAASAVRHGVGVAPHHAQSSGVRCKRGVGVRYAMVTGPRLGMGCADAGARGSDDGVPSGWDVSRPRRRLGRRARLGE